MPEGRNRWRRVAATAGVGLAIAALSILGIALLAATVVAGLAAFVAIRVKRFFQRRDRQESRIPRRESRPHGPGAPDDIRFVDAVDVSAEIGDMDRDRAGGAMDDPRRMPAKRDGAEGA